MRARENTDQYVEVYGFRDSVDDGRSIKQDGIRGESSPGRKDSTFSLGHIVFEIFARHLGLLAINSISCTKKISWLC